MATNNQKRPAEDAQLENGCSPSKRATLTYPKFESRFNDERTSDFMVTIKKDTESATFYVHKVIVMRSTYFATMLEEDHFKEAGDREVVLNDTPPREMGILLKSLYTEELESDDMDIEQMLDLYALADKYDFNQVITALLCQLEAKVREEIEKASDEDLLDTLARVWRQARPLTLYPLNASKENPLLEFIRTQIHHHADKCLKKLDAKIRTQPYQVKLSSSIPFEFYRELLSSQKITLNEINTFFIANRLKREPQVAQHVRQEFNGEPFVPITSIFPIQLKLIPPEWLKKLFEKRFITEKEYTTGLKSWDGIETAIIKQYYMAPDKLPLLHEDRGLFNLPSFVSFNIVWRCGLYRYKWQPPSQNHSNSRHSEPKPDSLNFCYCPVRPAYAREAALPNDLGNSFVFTNYLNASKTIIWNIIGRTEFSKTGWNIPWRTVIWNTNYDANDLEFFKREGFTHPFHNLLSLQFSLGKRQ